MAGIRADGADTAWCALRAATVVGVRHRLAGAPAEDAWAWGGDADRVVVAVADGLGALVGSGPVAAAVAEAAVAAVLGAADLDQAVDAANRAVAGGGGGASTLVLASVSRDGSAELIRVGDSTAFRLSGGVWSEVFGDRAAGAGAYPGDEGGDQPGEEAAKGVTDGVFGVAGGRSGDDDADGMRSLVTAALPASVPAVELARCHLDGGDALVLVSDGVGDPLRDGPTTVAPGLAANLSGPPHPLALAAQADFSRLGCQDDRTVVGVWLSVGSAILAG